MKINNETKTGILVVVAVGILIIGFNFLRGKNIFSEENKLYAVYTDVQGLAKSNPVIINGLRVGRIDRLDGGEDLKSIIVTIVLFKPVNIPENSLAFINPTLIGSPSMEIQLGSATKFLHNGDTLVTSASAGAFDEALKMINPVLYEVRNSVKSLDSVLHIITNVFDANTKNNVRDIVSNLNTITKSFAVSAVSLETMMDAQQGSLSHSLVNVEKFTRNLNANNDQFNAIVANAETASKNLAAVNLQSTIDSLNVAINNFKEGSAKINSKDGSLGLLLNDKELYNNLQSTSNKMNILLDDIRVHPKRYVNISIFGKKDKGNYITAPLIDDTIKIVNQ